MCAARLAISITLVSALAIVAAPLAPIAGMDNVRAIGDVTNDKGTVAAKGPTATLLIGDAEMFRMTAEFKFAEKAGAFSLQVIPTEAGTLTKQAALYASVSRDAPGLQLVSHAYNRDTGKNAWDAKTEIGYYAYWPAPTDKVRLAQLEGSGIAPRSLKDRWLRLRVDADKRHVRLWLDGLLVAERSRANVAKGPVAITIGQGDQVRNIVVAPLTDSLLQPVDLTTFAHEKLATPIGKDTVTVGVSFELANAGQSVVDLRKAGWIEQKSDPPDYYENYEGGPPVVHDPRMPLLRVPLADYTAAHVLCVADDDPATTPNFTLRAGKYGYADQVVFHSMPGTSPRKAEAGKIAATEQVATPAGPLFHVRVPMTEAFAQDLDRFLEIELTKEIRLARRQPDPCRFRSRPLGLPSGVKIAGITLEKSPLQMRVSSKETGHAFFEPQKPAFQVRLTNITAAAQAYELNLTLTHFDGSTLSVIQKGSVPAEQSAEIPLEVSTAKRGYHDVVVTLKDGGGRVLLERKTSCCLLPPDTRKHRDTSPFGTWDFCGGHFTPDDPDITGPLYVKLGLRYGMFSFKPDKRAKYGILAGNEPNIYESGVKGWEDFLKSTPDQPPIALLFHETAVSGKHITRVPDLFCEVPYKFDAEEQKTFQKIRDAALKTAKEMRAKYPNVHLRLGNGPLPVKEAMYQAKFPPELFDSGGNEAGCFGRPPEAQPPDCVAYNASIWMDRRMLDTYGYRDKPVSLCLETCYPATSPGNVPMRDQADYLVRHALHALAWEMKQIKLGQICDMGNGYYFSNWGAIGFVNSKPELNVKPSFVALATLTRVLDGAKFVRVVPMGSPALYGLEFTRPDGTQAHAFWTLRGKRPVRLLTDKPGPWTLINDQGIETPILAGNGVVEIELSSSLVYLVGAGRVEGVGPRSPVYAEKPAGKATVLSPLADLADWTIEANRDPELEYYDFMCPRRKGDFTFTPITSFEGKDKVLKVTPFPVRHGKDTMPMYAVLAHKTGIPVPDKPTEIGVWVNGNGGWGRLMFELTDASGQRWISIGAEQQGIPRKWIEDMVPADMLAKWPKPAINDWNTGDVFGTSRINFDGWRWLAFPLPGNYPGEKHPWPANSQWRWDKDGVVHYPLTFRRLIIEMPEKVLHVNTFAAPPRLEIYLKELIVGQDDRQHGYVLGADR
jgi:hypothetical protein